MTIYGLDNVASRGGQTPAVSETIGKHDFLKMLVAQMQNQDPLNPMDATGFTAQLAEFSSLEQLQNINGTLNAIDTSQTVLTNSQAVGFIGKNIMAVGDSFHLGNGGSEALQFSLNGTAAAVYVKIYDQDGNFIQNLEYGAMAAGPQTVKWDGRNSSGNPAPDGSYHFTVSAVDENNGAIAAVTFSHGLVSGINYRDGQAYLITNNQEILLGNVVKVMEDTGS